MEGFTPFLIVMGIVFGGLVVFAYVVKMLEVRRARTWKTAPGKIIQSKTRAHTRRGVDGKTSRETVPDIVYEYEVGGRRYKASRLSFAERITGPDLEAALARYPVGKTVQVSYNPLRPSEAVLEREMPAAVGMSVSLLAVFFVAGGLLIPLALGGAADRLRPYLANPDRAPFVALAAGMGLLVLLLALAMQREAWAAGGWRTAQGQIISAEAEAYRDWSMSGSGGGTLRTFFRPSIAYTFEVDGREYISDRVTFGGWAGWSSSRFFQRRLAQYPVGSPVTVYYNPGNPSDAVLERRAWGLPLLLGVGVMLLGLAALAAIRG